MFLGWFDDNPKKTLLQKLESAVERYVSKFNKHPAQVLVNSSIAPELSQYAQTPIKIEVEGIWHEIEVEIKGVDYIRPHHFWVGMPDSGGEDHL